jgi:pyrroline-5-carboxylate reductase
MNNNKVAFVGGGNMTRAIAGGLVASGFPASDILIAEPLPAARDGLTATFPGATISADNDAVVQAAGCIVLAVKPQVLPAVCRDLQVSVQRTKPLIVSIAAGPRSTDIDNWLGGGLSVVRVMPNQPALLGKGVSGLFANARTSAAEQDYATNIMAAVGSVVVVASESDIDAVTAVSGSGPAYFYLLIDMLAKTAMELGLPEDDARTLAIDTAAGAAALASNETSSMDELIARVRSPGGTTAAALDSLENADVRAIFSAAITAACNRASELGDAAEKSQE